MVTPGGTESEEEEMLGDVPPCPLEADEGQQQGDGDGTIELPTTTTSYLLFINVVFLTL